MKVEPKKIAVETAKFLADGLGGRVVPFHGTSPSDYDAARAAGWDCFYVSMRLVGEDINEYVRPSQQSLLKALLEFSAGGFVAFASVPPVARGFTATERSVSVRCQVSDEDSGQPMLEIDVFVQSNVVNDV